MGLFDTNPKSDTDVLCLLRGDREVIDVVCDIRDFISQVTGTKTVELFQMDKRLNRFSLWSQEGPAGRAEGVHRHDPLINLLEREHRILRATDWQSLPAPEGRTEVIQDLEFLVPLCVSKEIVGILGLGKIKVSEVEVKGQKQNLDHFLMDCSGALAFLLEDSRLRSLVIEDPATGLRSHDYFNVRLTDEVERAIRYGRKVSLMMMRVEPLSQVMQKISPITGEKILKKIGTILLENTRRTNVVARFQSDPDIFQMMMPEIPGDVANRQGQALAARIAKLEMEEIDTRFRVHFGVATYPDDAPSRKLLTAKAFEELKVSLEKGGQEPSSPSSESKENVIPEYIRILDIRSPEMVSVLETAHRIADSKSTILIQGETGVGKEILSEFVHRHSGRSDKILVKVNCGALPETLVESELFGHEKGSFTGAESRRIGRFEQAHTGTIFLDEIGELTPLAQVKLLRIIEGKPFYRLGGTTPINTDVRIIAATNRDLLAEVQNGQFREDLYYRLNVVSFTIPALKDRREDIPLLVSRFMKDFNKENGTDINLIHPETMDILYRYSWPGNVRELKNAVERAMILTGKTGTLIARYLPPSVLKGVQAEVTSSVSGSDDPVMQPTAMPSSPDSSIRFPDLNERQRQVIEYLRIHPSISNQEYVNMMRVSRRTCVRDLNSLIDKKLVVREGKKKSCVYRLAEGI